MGCREYVGLLLLSLSLLSVSMVRSQSSCIGELQGACGTVLKTLGEGGSLNSSCCSAFQGLEFYEAADCVFKAFYFGGSKVLPFDFYTLDNITKYVKTILKICGVIID
ncbi:hypothetical protein LR48_Vigan11g107200 [Vigna angularis]|uniref:Bifunctional inhibitor/plant lipid transfer protein/seed storage helical domain-containing protein n=2 Tax=Phaseolus angularis TaxID=3914 RepID=A0A0L9VTG4_PHAAN|nr:uncharacterized protein HKW66_Vig0200620 [Vigna angularis]KOM58039.1 hypothetical protein LR48_Vigan11g107200 [Vigna angularis]BAT97436.1 hypothetical protein VIGAN_09088100 [Vigna angularis var. angularis]